MSEEEQPEAQAEDSAKIFRPQKIYLKDASFETPNSPALFTKKWDPKLGVEINNSVSVLGDDIYEVILTVTATVKVEDKTAFLAEVHQAGIFVLKGLEPDELQRLQQVFCLRPLDASSFDSNGAAVARGRFPQLLLAPMNFNALYAKKLQQATDQNETSDE